MFTKPFRIKSQSAIRGSDRKKIRAEVSQNYPALREEDLAELFPKEEMTSMKIFSHSGDTVMVFCLKKNPIFFEYEKQIFPTVYTLWKFPKLLPAFSTWSPVVSKFQRGADLMLPGVVVGCDVTPQTFRHVGKGDRCCVNTVDNKAPIAVGMTAMSGSDMYDSGMRGKGVQLLHVYKDQLWAHGDQSEPPELGPVFTTLGLCVETQSDSAVSETNRNANSEFREEILSGDVEVAEDAGLSVDAELSADVGVSGNGTHSGHGISEEVRLSHDVAVDIGVSCMHELNLGDSKCVVIESPTDEAITTDQLESAENDISTPDEMDKLLYYCFLCALKGSMKKDELPILTRKLLRTHMIPWCPPGKSVDIRKSSYKKLSKFLHEMTKLNLIVVKEFTKGVESVTEINRAHPEFKGFVVPEKPEVSDMNGGEDKSLNPPKLVELYGVSGCTRAIFEPSGISKGTPLEAGSAKKYLTEYVKMNNLTDSNNSRQVVLDGTLSDALLNRGEKDVTNLPWDQLFSRCLAKMNPMHSIAYSGKEVQIYKGKVQPVVLTIAQRAGNKKVTLIENLEQFGIDPHAFAHEVQIGVAGSTAVNPLPGKKQGVQVLVQGNQINFIANALLEKYQINKKYLVGLEKAPKIGKKKR